MLTLMLIINLSTMETKNQAENQPGVTGELFFKVSNQLNFAVVLWMVSVPEGLPLAIGVSLAFSVMKMFNDNLLVRKLDTPEKLGTIEEICCGKTGTITTGVMKIAKFHVKDNQRELRGNYEPELKNNSRKNTILNCELNTHMLESELQVQFTAIELIQESILYNCEARVEMKHYNFEPVGNATECAFLRFLQDAEVPVHQLINYKLNNMLASLPFQSSKRRSITAIRLHDKQVGEFVRIYIKGAPETVMSHCKFENRE